MSQAQSTRCPHCQTAFRVTPKQLAIAKGAVRCGSCLEVFNAMEHPLQKSTLTADSSPNKTADKRKSSQTNQPESIEALHRDWSDPGRSINSPRKPDRPDPDRLQVDENDLLFNAEEDQDDFLFMDDDAEDQKDDLVHESLELDSELEFTDSFLSLEQKPNRSDESSSRQGQQDAEAEPIDRSADDSWALDMLTELEGDSDTPSPHHDNWSLDDDSRSQPATAHSSNPSQSKARAPRPTSAAQKTERVQLETAFATHDLDQMSRHQEVPPANHRWAWLLSGGLLMFLLVIQLAWWERASLSQRPALQGLYVEACNLIGCTLPEPIPDAGSIRALSSVLRPLPNGQMRLDAVFVNRSERPAPYPVLQLVIQNFQGTVTADGLFVPEDYVGGEVQPGDMMPPGRPVSISINLNRPVEELNNFRLTFHY